MCVNLIKIGLCLAKSFVAIFRTCSYFNILVNLQEMLLKNFPSVLKGAGITVKHQLCFPMNGCVVTGPN